MLGGLVGTETLLKESSGRGRVLQILKLELGRHYPQVWEGEERQFKLGSEECVRCEEECEGGEVDTTLVEVRWIPHRYILMEVGWSASALP